MERILHTSLDFTLKDWKDCRDDALRDACNPRLPRKTRELMRVNAKLAALEVGKRKNQDIIVRMAVKGDAIRTYKDIM